MRPLTSSILVDLEETLRLQPEEYFVGLPEKIQRLEESWRTWQRSLGRDMAALQSLKARVNELGDSGTSLGLTGLGDKARTLSLYIDSLNDNTPSTRKQTGTQNLQMSALLMALKDEAFQSASALTLHKATGERSDFKKTEPATSEEFESYLVFLVDPAGQWATELKLQLEYNGYAVQVLTGLDRLGQIIKQDKPAALILDLEMIENGGNENRQVLAHLLQNQEKSIPILFTSNQTDLEARLAAVRAGGNGFFARPIEFDRMLATLNKLIVRDVPTPYRVLIVDDDDDLSTLYSVALKGAGINSHIVNDPFQLVPLLSSYEPDLILMDVYMADYSGLELAAVIRQQEAYLNTPIVFLSTETNLDKQLAAMHLGGDDFLTKPIQMTHLVSAVSARAERSRILRAFNEELELRVEERTRALRETTEHLLSEITRRKQVEEELLATTRQTIKILESITDGFVALDYQGQFTYLNRRAESLLRRKRKELLGKNVQVEFAQMPGFSLFQRALEIGQQQTAGEFEEFDPTFKSWFEVHVYPFNEGLSIYFRDITERKRTEEEMWKALEKERELNELKSRFVTTTSHEFRTPLSTIQATAELLEHYAGRWSEEKKGELFRRIETAVKRLTALLNDVLLISKAESSKLEFQPVKLELNQFCHRILDDFQTYGGTANSIRFVSACQPLEGWIDEKLLSYILNNLLSNAVKYSPQGELVLLELGCETDQVVFRIKDRGIGIPPEDQVHLFEAFYRAGNVGNIPGTGLGLTIVRKSVDLHKGSITFLSSPESGTSFTIKIPLNRSDLAQG